MTGKGSEPGAISPTVPLLILTACAGIVAWLDILSIRSAPSSLPILLRKTIFQEDENGCGPAALAMVLNDHGINCTPADIAAEIGRSDSGASMRDLRSFAERRGVTATGWRLTYEDLRSAPKPAILLLAGGHFVVVDSVDCRGRTYCRDPEAGNILYQRGVITRMWHGETLVFRARGP